MNLRILRWAVVALLVVGGLAFVVKGANSPADPTLAPASADGQVDGNGVTMKRTPFGEFGEIAFRIEGGSGEELSLIHI